MHARDLALSGMDPRRGHNLSMRRLVDEYLEACRHSNGERQLVRIRKSLTRLVDHLGARRTRLSELQVADVLEYRNPRLDEGSRTTVNMEGGFLKSALRHAIAAGHILEHPVLHLLG